MSNYRWVERGGKRFVVEADSKADSAQCAMPHKAMAGRGKRKCPACGANLAGKLEESRDLVEVGTTHEPTIGSKGKGLFGMPGKQLPAVIQHVYNDLVESGKHKVGGRTYALAIGIVKNWAHGKGAKDPKTIAKAAAAIAEWEKLKAEAHAKK